MIARPDRKERTMRQLVKGFMVAAAVTAVAAMSTPAWAQSGGEADSGSTYPTQQETDSVTKGVVVPKRDGVRKVLISGGIDFWGVYRYFELETGPSDDYAGEKHRVGDDNQIARFRQGYLDVNSSALGFKKESWEATLRIGLFNARYDARGFPAGEGNPFMLDVIHSENPFTGTPSLFASSPTANGTPAASVTFANGTTAPIVAGGPLHVSRNTFLGGNAWFHNWSGQKKTQEAGGIALNQRLIRDEESAFNLDLDLGALVILETGLAQNDVNIGYAVADISFGSAVEERGIPSHASRFSVMGIFFGEGDSYVGDAGGALEWLLFDGLIELYGEGHFQAGAYYNVRDTVATPDPGSDVTRQLAYGGFGGIRIQAPWHEFRPYFEISGWYMSGDDGNPRRNDGVRRSTNRDMLTLENNNDTLIIEGSQIGFDIDTNYLALKAKAGVTWKQLEFSAVGGWFRLNRKPDPTFYAAALPLAEQQKIANGGVGEFDDQLGVEADLTITWRPTDTVAIWLTGGMLFGSGLLDDLYNEDTFMAGSLGASVRF
jgi:hypothetical protein